MVKLSNTDKKGDLGRPGKVGGEKVEGYIAHLAHPAQR
jgi:hypothetical protein